MLRLRVEPGRRRDPLPERGGEHERLERGARLALGLRGEVELALAVVLAADHGEHLAVPRVDRDQRGGRPVRVRQHVPDRLTGEALQVEVDRRRDLESAAEDLRRALGLDQLLLDVVDEVLALARLGARQAHVLRFRQWRAVRLDVVGAGDVVLLQHRLQHDAAALACEARVLDGVEAARVLRDAGEERRLGEGEEPGAVAEVRERRLLHAVGAVAEVDRVQVGGQDPLLRPLLRAGQLPGERRLAHLAADRALVAHPDVLDELLRDRRAALDDALVTDVRPECPADRAHVDAVVLPEAAVLDVDDRLLHQGVDVGGGDERAVLRAAEHGEHAFAGAVVDDAVPLGLLDAGGVELWQLAGYRPDQAEAERNRTQRQHDRDQGEEAELANAAPSRRARRTVIPTRPQGPKSSPVQPRSVRGRRRRSARAWSGRSR